MNEYIGVSAKSGEVLKSSTIIVDSDKKDVYIIPQIFSQTQLSLDKRHLYKYKVINASVGISMGRDINGEMLFLGDEVRIEYYNYNSSRQTKLYVTAVIYYDKNLKIFYMKTKSNKYFLFEGDKYHMISCIKRIGRYGTYGYITDMLYNC